jgi:hypothetical protein
LVQVITIDCLVAPDTAVVEATTKSPADIVAAANVVVELLVVLQTNPVTVEVPAANGVALLLHIIEMVVEPEGSVQQSTLLSVQEYGTITGIPAPVVVAGSRGIFIVVVDTPRLALAVEVAAKSDKLFAVLAQVEEANFDVSASPRLENAVDVLIQKGVVPDEDRIQVLVGVPEPAPIRFTLAVVVLFKSERLLATLSQVLDASFAVSANPKLVNMVEVESQNGDVPELDNIQVVVGAPNVPIAPVPLK